MRIPAHFDYWRPRPRRGTEDTVWAAQYATAGSALAAIFADMRVDQDEWVRLMGDLRERGYPTVGDGAMWTEELAVVRAGERVIWKLKCRDFTGGKEEAR